MMPIPLRPSKCDSSESNLERNWELVIRSVKQIRHAVFAGDDSEKSAHNQSLLFCCCVRVLSKKIGDTARAMPPYFTAQTRFVQAEKPIFPAVFRKVSFNIA